MCNQLALPTLGEIVASMSTLNTIVIFPSLCKPIARVLEAVSQNAVCLLGVGDQEPTYQQVNIAGC